MPPGGNLGSPKTGPPATQHEHSPVRVQYIQQHPVVLQCPLRTLFQHLQEGTRRVCLEVVVTGEGDGAAGGLGDSLQA